MWDGPRQQASASACKNVRNFFTQREKKVLSIALSSPGTKDPPPLKLSDRRMMVHGVLCRRVLGLSRSAATAQRRWHVACR